MWNGIFESPEPDAPALCGWARRNRAAREERAVFDNRAVDEEKEWA